MATARNTPRTRQAIKAKTATLVGKAFALELAGCRIHQRNARSIKK